jgi:hypothetical protein
MERETGFEPATSSLGIQTYIKSKSLARFCRDFLNLQRLAESAFSEPVIPNEAQIRQGLQSKQKGFVRGFFLHDIFLFRRKISGKNSTPRFFMPGGPLCQ